jgi:hypothetical protein
MEIAVLNSQLVCKTPDQILSEHERSQLQTMLVDHFDEKGEAPVFPFFR